MTSSVEQSLKKYSRELRRLFKHRHTLFQRSISRIQLRRASNSNRAFDRRPRSSQPTEAPSWGTGSRFIFFHHRIHSAAYFRRAFGNRDSPLIAQLRTLPFPRGDASGVQ